MSPHKTKFLASPITNIKLIRTCQYIFKTTNTKYTLKKLVTTTENFKNPFLEKKIHFQTKVKAISMDDTDNNYNYNTRNHNTTAISAIYILAILATLLLLLTIGLGLYIFKTKVGIKPASFLLHLTTQKPHRYRKS